ncbi:MAG: ABC transporter ATP-binding protein [Gammaproteobacteria bacterium]|nr:ABC transporter ATP-binding protein [Gammaproteobacteria bacterium]
MAVLELHGVGKSFGATEVLRRLDLTLAQGELLVLVGPSGCGKSTLLNLIAGFEPPTTGTILIDGQDVRGVEPSRRNIAMVFQSYALYPHLTVADNLAFALRLAGVGRAARERAVAEAAALLQITDLLHRKPAALSGGQRQRVAMGRALVRRPRLFLFDEPLSNLDARLRVEMRTLIKRLHQELGTTTVYVTHDQVEAMTLADRVAVMRAGVVQQLATPEEIYHRPATRFVAEFIGAPAMNLLPARLVAVAGGWSLVLANNDELVRLPLAKVAPEAITDGERDVLLGLRPEAIRVVDVTDPERHFCGRIDLIEPTGADTYLISRVAGTDLTIRAPASCRIAAGVTVGFAIDAAAPHLFDPGTGARLTYRGGE